MKKKTIFLSFLILLLNFNIYSMEEEQSNNNHERGSSISLTIIKSVNNFLSSAIGKFTVSTLLLFGLSRIKKSQSNNSNEIIDSYGRPISERPPYNPYTANQSEGMGRDLPIFKLPALPGWCGDGPCGE